jgi:2'-5' RNA ligase
MNSVSKRIFLAVEVSPEWKSAINKFIEENKQLNYRWIAEENWHFTLLFIGDFPVDKLKSIYALLEKCFAEIPTFEIDFEAFTYFPVNRPRMIWMKGKESRAFASAEKVAFQTLKHFSREAYMEFDAKPSQKSIPHITLSRLKFVKKLLPDLINPNLNLAPIRVKEIVLYESQLKPTGSVYTKLAGFRLKNSCL